ncbi:hypothetical protein KI659_08150 [Litoribacter alkaliphilus]|uniref:DUF3551 domain-containing protein n=1 Tax=Litoribacter ruber TaxID=702568 RepID=A0AAP2G3Z2_9BACT|nr:hypothetical protein [Litoribacter alkaliphilus]MBS9523985.1 hypothetical protein [Litoribacter alkaliphilus]
MKKKVSVLMGGVLFLLLNVFPQIISAQETVPCGNALIDYKKQWLSTNCKYKENYTCLLRCDQPQLPDPPSLP